MEQKRILIVFSGIPGSGKSTWAKTFCEKNTTTYISRDEIRYSMLKSNEEYFSHEKEVVKTFFSRINKALHSEKGPRYVIADATHNTEKARNELLDALNLKDVDIWMVNFDTDVRVCMERNSKRTGRTKVPSYMIQRMALQHTAPSNREKYRYAKILNVRGN